MIDSLHSKHLKIGEDHLAGPYNMKQAAESSDEDLAFVVKCQMINQCVVSTALKCFPNRTAAGRLFCPLKVVNHHIQSNAQRPSVFSAAPLSPSREGIQFIDWKTYKTIEKGFLEPEKTAQVQMIINELKRIVQ